MDNIKKEFGLKVKEYRLLANLSQEDLAEKAGITPQTLSGIENGHGFPSYPVLCKIVDTLNVYPASLFTFSYSGMNAKNDELTAILLENFTALNNENRKTILYLMKFLRSQQK